MHAHLNLKARAPARLDYLRAYAADGKWVRPMTWRDVRFATFKSRADIGQGLNDKKPIWYVNPCKYGYFYREKFADETVNFKHKGYYTDTEYSDTARGIVVALPHGKYIAGYYWSSNDERVYFPEIYTDSDDAARAADNHAEHFADVSREDSERFNSARELENGIEDALHRLRECIALRNINGFSDAREAIPDLIESIRDKRETLQTEFKDYI